MDVWYFAVTLCVRNQRKRKINLQNIKKLLPSGFVRIPGAAAFLYLCYCIYVSDKSKFCAGNMLLLRVIVCRIWKKQWVDGTFDLCI